MTTLLPACSLPPDQRIIGEKYKVVRKVKDNLIIATDELSRTVAIKTIKSNHYLSTSEAKALATISENILNVVRLYHCFTEEDCFIMVMEFVGERTLNDFLPTEATCRTDLNLISEILLYLGQALRGLEYLHASGWYHCDIKPANIGIYDKADKKAVLLDFGLAYQEKNPNAHKNREYVSFDGGTEGFKSPERKRSPLADIFAFGKTMECLFPKCEEEPRIGKSLRDVIKRATEEDPAKRYQNVKSLREDLSRVHFWEAKSNFPDWLTLPNYYEKNTEGFLPQNIKAHWYNDSSEINYDVPAQYQSLYDSITPQVRKWIRIPS